MPLIGAVADDLTGIRESEICNSCVKTNGGKIFFEKN